LIFSFYGVAATGGNPIKNSLFFLGEGVGRKTPSAPAISPISKRPKRAFQGFGKKFLVGAGKTREQI